MALILPFVQQGLVIRCSGTNGTTTWANIFHAKYGSGTPTSGDLNTLASSISSLWGTAMAPTISSSAQLTQVVLQDLASVTGAAGLWAGTPVNGGVAGLAGPAGLSICISWQVARRWRGGHCRTYLPAIDQNGYSDQRTISTTRRGTAAAAALAWLNGINALNSTSTGPLVFSMLSYFSKPLFPTPPHIRTTPVLDPIVGYKVHGRLDSQRRRYGKEFG